MKTSHTIQVWPSGQGYEYRGDPFGPLAQRDLRFYGRSIMGADVWSKGVVEEWTEIRASLKAERYIDKEVLKCDSSLVCDLLEQEKGEWTSEHVRNLYPDPENWDVKQCREWLDEHVGYDVVAVDELREAVRENAEAQEIFEWWAVTDWLARELIKSEEPVLENIYGTWWGRTCTGQAMKMDGTLQNIARRHE